VHPVADLRLAQAGDRVGDGHLSRSSRAVRSRRTAAFGLPLSSKPAVVPRSDRSRGASVLRLVSAGRSLAPVGSRSFSHTFETAAARDRPQGTGDRESAGCPGRHFRRAPVVR
jgi:hypothetical protein